MTPDDKIVSFVFNSLNSANCPKKSPKKSKTKMENTDVNSVKKKKALSATVSALHAANMKTQSKIKNVKNKIKYESDQ